MSTIIERIKHIADENETTLTAIERKIGASKGVLSRAYRNKSDIQSKWVSKIADLYPVWNYEWILTGKGDETGIKVSVRAVNDNGEVIYDSEDDTITKENPRPMVEIKDNESSFNTNADEIIKELTAIIKSQELRIRELTDRLLDR